MDRPQTQLMTVIVMAICFAACGVPAFASDEDPIERILAAGQQAMLERHYGQAVHILRDGLKSHADDNRLRLELGRAYLSKGSDGQSIQLFRKILVTEPNNRSANLELARALSYGRRFEESDHIYKELLTANAADEAAAIGLASNLLHQQRSLEARDVVGKALTVHSNSLRLQEYKDRIENGQLGGEERERVVTRNLFQMDGDFVRDTLGNHSWLSSQRVDLGIKAGLTNRLLFEQQFQHGRDDPFEAVETFSEGLRWRPRELLLFTAGGGAVRFNNGDVHAIYETSLAFQPLQHLVLGAGFSRVPITPDAEATEHRLTAQGWEAFASWTPPRWQISAHGARQHYSDGNIGNHENAEIVRAWGAPRLIFDLGYRYRHVGFTQELEHGYFSPNSYQSHLAMAGVLVRVGKSYRGGLIGRGGAESVAAGRSFNAAWEIHVRNEVLLGHWTLELDYSKYHMVQDTGAFGADAGRFAFTYHF